MAESNGILASCCRSTLSILGFLFLALTILSSFALIRVGMELRDCDLTCTEDTDGAELLNEGYYDCNGTAQP